MSVGFLDHQGIRVLSMDFSGLKNPADILRRIAEARQFMAAQPKRKEIRTLVDVSRMRYSEEVLQAFRELTRHDEPWEVAVAVCGLRGVGGIAFRALNLLTGSRLRGFDRRDDALAWLVKQGPAAP